MKQFLNRGDYDHSIDMLEIALRRARTGDMENVKALKRLAAIRIARESAGFFTQ